MMQEWRSSLVQNVFQARLNRHDAWEGPKVTRTECNCVSVIPGIDTREEYRR